MPPSRLAGLATTLALLVCSACSAEPPPSGPAQVCTSFTTRIHAEQPKVDEVFATPDPGTQTVIPCFQPRLHPDQSGLVACVVLVLLPEGTRCDPASGLSEPRPEVRAGFDADRRTELQGYPLPPDTVCELRQIAPRGGGCPASGVPGFCYLEGEPAFPCRSAIRIVGRVRQPAYLVCNEGC